MAFERPFTGLVSNIWKFIIDNRRVEIDERRETSYHFARSTLPVEKEFAA